ncbi:hypothetical protein L6452_17882 [Arctium lappa]|uniref:Uncharacterized protein n=1 Tax=Arctium lappa TaxID=4217 RepID=A0ACB9C4L0_ARCLA|nr:hypothetical protein L6452_17882 [Arctium lappa]
MGSAQKELRLTAPRFKKESSPGPHPTICGSQTLASPDIMRVSASAPCRSQTSATPDSLRVSDLATPVSKCNSALATPTSIRGSALATPASKRNLLSIGNHYWGDPIEMDLGQARVSNPR